MQAFGRLSTDNSCAKYIAPTLYLYQRYAREISEVPEEVVQIAIGSGHLVFLGESGRVWVTGSNESGQLGLGDTVSRDSVTSVDSAQPISQVAAGFFHTLLLTETGVMLVTGDTQIKQLRVKVNPNQLRYTEASFIAPIKLIGAAGYNSVVVTESGQLYVTGYNCMGQLGLWGAFGWHPFTYVELPAEVTQFKTTNNVTAVVTRAGELWFSGAYNVTSLANPSVTTFTRRISSPVMKLEVEGSHSQVGIMYVTDSGCRFAL